jgi:hypothetical protein
MAKQCSDCIYFDDSPATQNNPVCRHNSPVPLIIAGQATKWSPAIWPEVDPSDWCGDGYNAVDGSYDLNPTAARVIASST